MTFRYFAYGSNLWEPWLRRRCPSAMVVGPATLEGWTAVYDKPSTDGSSKLNIRRDPGSSVEGVTYEIDESERSKLDEAEPRYTPVETDHGVTYTYEGEPSTQLPYDWYVELIFKGARSHGITAKASDSVSDPVAPGIRPADETDVDLMMSILSDGIRSGGDRYYSHPGEVGWWMYHWDERQPTTWWVQGEDAFAMAATGDPDEIMAFARPGSDVWPVIDFSRRVLGNSGEVAWIWDRDAALEAELRQRGYTKTFDFVAFEWDLENRPIPEPALPDGWSIRPVLGEEEADERRRASHASFKSSMDPERHLQRYLRFMRSPVYNREHDLVAVREDGRIGAFVVWWADDSGVAQIEPFGTDPEFQRMGLGRALAYRTLMDMKAEGMQLARVCTDEPREPARDFYPGIGFESVGKLRNWDLPSET